ncbi:Ribose ABC transport system, permease protein RbsC (TC 3.A.1.2.1) [Olavius algarvensis spirochete endosymbiont]|uniref:ABC transporter permease n=1 Tax=Olavius algarvensis spirochete endosymbiont TaxID=260710 RepID=UPI00052C6C6E|nr:ABC transporter permease [Olavius algarvensis spirochete endosymbiont]KGM44199.1 ABC transporter permease [Alkalispirochaeta odontotermitis]VDB00628.1 Ribose ABC transport system, permease protein RbsC (TC 3.A.1.2.1) [Olavius algarvensis spirochete endosymbiont]
MNAVFEIVLNPLFAFSVLRVSTPILFAALGALISDKAGVINIALEGIMLISALAGVIFSAISGSAFFGLFMALFFGGLVAFGLGYVSLKLKTDVILAGIAINLIASGGTVFVLFLLTGDKGISSSLASKLLPKIDIPILKSIPILGPILSGHNILTYFAFISVFLVWFLLYRTPLGLRIRAVGENEHAVDSVGISVVKTRFIALIISGVMAGFGGAYMTMGYISWFSRDMTAGRGFIALAAESMGGATPLGSMLSSLLFGFFDALSNSLQLLKIPYEFVSMLPYVATVVGLVIYTTQKTKRMHRMRIKAESKKEVL